MNNKMSTIRKIKKAARQAKSDTNCSTCNFAQPQPNPPIIRLLDKFAGC